MFFCKYSKNLLVEDKKNFWSSELFSTTKFSALSFSSGSPWDFAQPMSRWTSQKQICVSELYAAAKSVC